MGELWWPVSLEGTIQVSQETTKGLGSLHELTFWEVLLLWGGCPPWKFCSPWLRDRKSTEATPVTLYLRSQNELVDQSYPTLCDPMDCSAPGFPPHHQLLELAQTHDHRVSDVIQLFHPLSSPSPPAFRVFSSESVLCIRWPKYWSFSFSISPSNEYSGLISFRIDWFGLLAVQGTLKSLLQHHSSKG